MSGEPSGTYLPGLTGLAGFLLGIFVFRDEVLAFILCGGCYLLARILLLIRFQE